MVKTSVFLTFIIIFFSGCDARKNIFLQDGYKIVRIYGDAHMMADRNGKGIIMPNVVNAADNENYIIGLRNEADPKLELPDGFTDQPYGYFIYNKKDGSLTMGLSYGEFIHLLEEKSISIRLD